MVVNIICTIESLKKSKGVEINKGDRLSVLNRNTIEILL